MSDSKALGGDAVVADQRVGLAEDLAVVGGIGDGLGVADHARVENDFPRDLGEGAEAFARPDAAVFEDEDRFQTGKILSRSAHYTIRYLNTQSPYSDFAKSVPVI